jgi:hypothetical protein
MKASSIFGALTMMKRVYILNPTKRRASKWNVAVMPIIRGKFVSAASSGVRGGSGIGADMMRVKLAERDRSTRLSGHYSGSDPAVKSIKSSKNRRGSGKGI